MFPKDGDGGRLLLDLKINLVEQPLQNGEFWPRRKKCLPTSIVLTSRWRSVWR